MSQEEGRVKATHKIKKKTQGGFYSEFKRTSTQGKSSKELKLMVEDMRNNITHQLARIRRLKYVILKIKEERNSRITLERHRVLRGRTVERIREKKNKKISSLSRKLTTREINVEKRDKQIDDLQASIKNQSREIAKLLREVDKKDEIIKEVKSVSRQVKIVEKPSPLTEEEQRAVRLAKKPLDKRGYNVFENSLKITKFAKDNDRTPEELTMLLQLHTEGSLQFSDFSTGTRKSIAKLELLEYVNFHKTKQVKHYFLTSKGEELVINLKNYISHGKI